jgi:pyridinium-3,5-bisthiocarboxylic acid mononucleotide nickel chelatase
MAQKVAYLDCHSGISGSMLLAALLDAGFSPDTLRRTLEASSLHGYQLQYDTLLEKGIRGLRFKILFEEQQQPNYFLSDSMAVFHTFAISPSVRDRAMSIFQRLAEVEAAVQGIDVEAVCFEAADVLETIITLVGVILGTEELSITQLYASSLPFTKGHVQTRDGFLLVPRPVTLELLRQVGAPWKPCAIEEELVTPTAAAMLATLARFDTPVMTIERVGYGFGGHRLPWLNCLRLCLGKTLSEIGVPNQEVDTDWVAVIESHIDNMSGEILGGLMERLFTAGALDVSYTPIQMKKNRPATLVTLICLPEDGERLALILLRETSTLGVRIQQVQRRKAHRAQELIATPFGPMLVKIKRLGSRIVSAMPEYEECQRIAREQDMPLADVYEVACRAIQVALGSGR